MAITRVRHAWSRLAERERRLVAVALVLIGGTLVWTLGIAPALTTLRSAPERLSQLDVKLQSMQAMVLQAKELQGRAPIRRDEALRILESSVQQRLAGKARISNAGDQVTVTLSGAEPQAFAQWLAQVRGAARVTVQQARLLHSPGGWSGSVVLQLPPP